MITSLIPFNDKCQEHKRIPRGEHKNDKKIERSKEVDMNFDVKGFWEKMKKK